MREIPILKKSLADESHGRLYLLYELFHSISSTLDTEKALNLIIDAAVRITGATCGSLILVDWEHQRLDIKVSRGFVKHIGNIKLKVGEGVTGWVAQNGRPLLVKDVTQEPRYVQLKADIKSELAVPLALDDKVIGVLNVDSTQLHAFDQEDVALLTLLAKQSAQVIRNGQVHKKMLALEEQVRRAERLATVGELAVGLAHEIRNPLTIVKMLFDSGIHFDERDRQVIRDEMSRMNRIITNLLDYSRCEDSHKEPCDLNLSLENALILLSHEFDKRKILISKALASGLPPVLADAVQLQQVILNLLINAIEASPEECRLSIRSSRRGDNHVAVTIEDSGCGMPQEIQKKLFVPFTTTKPKGLGLGLSIVKRIIDDHNGAIEIVSREEQGTSVKIVLAAWTNEAGERPVFSSDQSPRLKQRDDSREARDAEHTDRG
ncbi:MAG: ATP-binding protein [bacterium]